jgi:hypothetical protein
LAFAKIPSEQTLSIFEWKCRKQTLSPIFKLFYSIRNQKSSSLLFTILKKTKYLYFVVQCIFTAVFWPKITAA